MTRQPAVANRVEQMLGVPVVSTAPVAGGDICTATRLRLSDGRVVFAKTLHQAPEGFFEAEARGLRWLAAAAEAGGASLPGTLGVAADCLVLAWVEPGKATAESAAALGTALEATHASGAAAYGADQDGFIGRLPLPNRTAETWAEFYATRRVLPYLKLARDRGAITDDDAAAVESLLGRLADLVPEECPARVHGDLWNGNVLWSAGGAALVDPAAHGGHRETDLGMLHLFGLPHLEKALEAYAGAAEESGRPLDGGWRERVGIHQVHPLLVHACMFGGGYGGRAADAARRLRG